MKVSLIDYTGAGSADPWYAALQLIRAKSTRLQRSEAEFKAMSEKDMKKELAYIANTIRSSWEFVSYTFKIEGISRACCDQIVRSRVGVSFAVMSMRSVDQSEFEFVIPDAVHKAELTNAFQDHMDTTAEFYRQMIKHGVPVQDARSVIPMCAESPLIAQYNLRALADIIAKRENLRAQGEYADVASRMATAVVDKHPWAFDFLYPARLRTPKLDAMLKEELGDSSPVDKPHVNDALKELDKLKGTWG